MCGEYGEKFQRPHYHAIIFNHSFEDRKFYKLVNDIPLYTSQILEDLWEQGFCTVGECTFQSAAYVARYIMKKITGEKAEQHYEKIDEITGEVIQILPEYTTMSRGGKYEDGQGGIGRSWYEKYKSEVFPSDYIIIKGQKMRPPTFYQAIFQIDDEKGYDELIHTRKKQAARHKKDNTLERLAVRETVNKAKLKLLKRSYENQ